MCNSNETVNYEKKLNVIGNYDILVAGAGPAGICAAVSAAHEGKRVALIERNGIIGGNLTAGCVGPILGRVIPGSKAEEINALLNGSTGLHHDIERAKIILTEYINDPLIDLYLHCFVTDVLTENGSVTGLVVSGQNGPSVLKGKITVDATGDGVVAALAGAPYELGRSGDGLMQPASVMFTIDGIDENQRMVCCHEEDDTALPKGNYLELCKTAMEEGRLPKNVGIVRLYETAYSKTSRMVNATQYNGVNGLEYRDVAKSSFELRKQMDQIVTFLKSTVPGFENCFITNSSDMVGFRETRRIIGDYVLTAEDMFDGRIFNDTAVHGANFCIDIHNPSGSGQAEPDMVSKTRPGDYDIPYRCMLPKNVENLLTCGRCISGTHRAHASYRVMNTAMALGQAAGTAAAVCIENGVSPRMLDAKILQERLRKNGVDI